jgi:hypothetical protein
MRRSKYGAVPTVVDNMRFASKREAAHYGTLKILERAGKISLLQLQPGFRLEVKGQLICTYVADFQYLDHGTMHVVTEDVKGMKTPVYRIKKKLLKALYDIDIVEI